MEHPGFFTRHGPFSLEEIVQCSAAEIGAGAQGSRQFSDIKPLSVAEAEHISFLDNPKYLADAALTKAGACFIKSEFAPRLAPGCTPLITPAPYHAFARALALFYPEAMRPLVCPDQPGSQQIHPTASIEDGAQIQPGAIIGAQAQIGAGSVIAAGAVIGCRVSVGRNCYIGPNASITHALIGNGVIIHAGSTIGQDGFGFALSPRGHLKVPQIGRVIIQDNVEIGSGTAIDRGALNDTIIGEGTKIDNLVQIGHNAVIGRNCVIVGLVGISGSTVLEDFVVIGGQAGVAGHLRIGAGAQIAAGSGVVSSVPSGARWGGAPAKPVSDWARETALLKRLNETLTGKALARLKKLVD